MSALSRGNRSIQTRTETSIATPVHGLSLLTRTIESSEYAMMAPMGVDALNTAICFRHSARGSDVASSDVLRANTVGATQSLVSCVLIIDCHG